MCYYGTVYHHSIAVEIEATVVIPSQFEVISFATNFCVYVK